MAEDTVTLKEAKTALDELTIELRKLFKKSGRNKRSERDRGAGI